ncbi:MAG: cob(I)yrinic acid a,c-diamide adenosyltransferase [Patescibacteria group bacterium]
MGLFYTGKGDKGKSIVGKKIIDKTSVEIEALGDLDELNSLLGIVRSSVSDKAFKRIILSVQENLFIIQANVAGFMLARRSLGVGGKPKFKPPLFKEEKIRELEKIIDRFEHKIKPAKKFIIPGAGEESAWLDYARAVSRRAERSVFRYSKRHSLNPHILSYMNRLSSLFFAMARMAVKKSFGAERYPQYR